MNFVAKLTVLLVVLVAADNSFAGVNFPSAIYVPVEGRVHLTRSATGGLDKSFSSFVDNPGWIFQRANEVVRATFDQGFKSAASWAVDVITRMELLVMADGSHAIFPDSGKPEEEQKHKVIAITVSKLLTNLKTMVRTDMVMGNVSRMVIHKDTEIPDTDLSLRLLMVKFLHLYFEMIDHAFEHDQELAAEYSKQKAEAVDMVKRDPKMQEALVKTWETDPSVKFTDKEAIMSFLRDKEVVREAYVNKMFMKEATKNFMMIFNSTHHEHYVYARALLKKAESSDFKSKISHMYHKALHRAGGMAYIETGFFVITDVLFEGIRAGVDADPTLSAEIKTLMKEIEMSTVYDIEMLHLDFSPL